MNVIDIINKNSLMSCGLRLAKDIESNFPGSEALIVGGCVRDIIMGNSAKDIDIATNADIEKIAERYHSADIGKSKDFGIVLVIFEGCEFEVAHFREESGSSDNRHPDSVKFVNDFEADTARRDITINSLGIDTDGNIIDHQNGIEDIENGIIRAVGIASDRFEEDALRIVRVARFSAKYDFKIESSTKSAMIEKRDLTKTLSVERIRDELIKISEVSGTALVKFLEILNEVGALDIHLPEVNGMRGFVHSIEYHPEGFMVERIQSKDQMKQYDPIKNPEHDDPTKYNIVKKGDLHDHTMAALNVSRSKNPLTNIAILFHDIGKTITQTFDEDGIVHYNGHERDGVELFKDIGKRLKFSNDQIDIINFAIKNHMLAHRLNSMKKAKVIAIAQNPNFKVLEEVSRADDESRMHLFDEKVFEDNLDKVRVILKDFGDKVEFEKKMTPLINGRMIINLATDEGVELKGPQIGNIKNAVRDIIIEKEFDITLQDTSRIVRDMVNA